MISHFFLQGITGNERKTKKCNLDYNIDIKRKVGTGVDIRVLTLIDPSITD